MALSDGSKSGIAKIIEEIFDRIALKFLGNIPSLRGKKILAISTKPNLGLANLFVQSMDNRPPNSIESEALKGLLGSAHDYIDALKTKTQENIIERLEDAKDEKAVAEILDSEMNKASSHMKMIVSSETTKVRNVGFTMDFTRVAASRGDMDPNCFFVIVRDGQACGECVRLHLNSDGTPRVWKFSELSTGYHVRGEDRPSVLLVHPHCRCSITYLPIGYGFNSDGLITFISKDHDEFEKQRSQ